MDSKKTEIVIDLYSDIACPWCYVGEKIMKTTLDKFLSDNPTFKAKINFHAYMIDPATKKNGEEYLAYNRRRWGGDGWTDELRERGRQVGCKFANWKTWPNTLLCHCLIAAGSKIEKHEEIVHDIFEYCYEQGENVSDKETLNKIAEKYAITNWDSKEIQTEVWNDDTTAKDKLDIHGVPNFRFNNGSVIGGSGDSSSFMKVFNKYK